MQFGISALNFIYNFIIIKFYYPVELFQKIW